MGTTDIVAPRLILGVHYQNNNGRQKSNKSQLCLFLYIIINCMFMSLDDFWLNYLLFDFSIEII